MSERASATTALVASTLAFAVCFASWLINSALVTFFLSNDLFGITEARVGWLLAAPVLTGALTRVPVGVLTDQFGGRRVFPLLMIVTAAALGLLSAAQTYSQYLICS